MTSKGIPDIYETHQVRPDIAYYFCILPTIGHCRFRRRGNQRQPKFAVVDAKGRLNIEIKAVIKQSDLKVVWRLG
jgi:hypothetical protein